MASSEADDEVEDSGALAAVGCLRALSTILESISSLPHLFIQIEPTLLPILRRMLTSDGQGIVLFNYNNGVCYISRIYIISTVCLQISYVCPLMELILFVQDIDSFEM